MNKMELKKKGFKHDAIHNEWYYDREDLDIDDRYNEGKVHPILTPEERRQFKPNDIYRCEFLKNGKRVGKVHYDAIRLIYDAGAKPFLEIYIQGGSKITIYQDSIKLWYVDITKDSSYITIMPSFNVVSFYGNMELDIKLYELKSNNKE